MARTIRNPNNTFPIFQPEFRIRRKLFWKLRQYVPAARRIEKDYGNRRIILCQLDCIVFKYCIVRMSALCTMSELFSNCEKTSNKASNSAKQTFVRNILKIIIIKVHLHFFLVGESF